MPVPVASGGKSRGNGQLLSLPLGTEPCGSEEAVGRGAVFSEPKWEVESGSVLGAWHAFSSFSGHLILVTSLWERCSLAYARFKEGNGGPKRLSLLKIQSINDELSRFKPGSFWLKKISDLYHENPPLPRRSICVGRLFF